MRHRYRSKRLLLVKFILIGVILLVGLSGILVSRWLSQGSRRPAVVEIITTPVPILAGVGAPADTAPTGVVTPLLRAIPVMGATELPRRDKPATPTTVTEAPTVSPAEESVTSTPVAEEETAWMASTNLVVTQPWDSAVAIGDPRLLPAPVIFVSRQIPETGTVYWDKAKGMPGVGPYSRFEVAAPGRLLLLRPDGSVQILVDGAQPTAASYHLIDVNAPDVAYDGTQIVFAGLAQGEYPSGAMQNPGGWRLYVINGDGSGLRQLTFADQHDLDLRQFGTLAQAFVKYDDTDPAWLPDGRIVFASTRYPSFGQYGGARTTNLFVINPDGSDLHRITSERNSAERPLIDPISGRIVYSRWWRNFRVPVNTLDTQAATEHEGYRQHLGLLSETDATTDDPIPGGSTNVNRNSWQLGTVNPDGTGLRLFAGGSGVFLAGEDGNHAYGGAFTADGILYANYFPMRNMTEAAGFGGIRRYERGAHGYTGIIGVTADGQYPVVNADPPSFGVTQSEYAADPVVLPNGRLIISWAPDISQDYGLYLINPSSNGENREHTRLFDHPNTTELRARLVVARPLPPLLPDGVTATASALPPLTGGPYDVDGTFTFRALNVYFNGPVDSEIINGIPVGQASTIRFYTDYQRQQPGSIDWLDWPILLQELPIQPDGSVVAQLPANVPLFEQIRTAQPDYLVPLTGRNSEDTPGVAHVLGLNFGRPGETGTCVGCHAGHSLIDPPENPADAQWTNLAPGATVVASSVHPTLGGSVEGLVDRRVQKGRSTSYWRSDPTQNPNQQWVQLTFPVPITIRTVRLYNPRADTLGLIQVNEARVRLFREPAAIQEIASATSGALTTVGVDVAFPDILSRVVLLELTNVSGTFNGEVVASLAEVEVIARAEAP